jgi:hypothetical protein
MNEQTHEMGSASSWMDEKILVTPRCSCGWFGFRVVADADKSDDAHFKAGMQWNQHMDTVRSKPPTPSEKTYFAIKNQDGKYWGRNGWSEKLWYARLNPIHKAEEVLFGLKRHQSTARIVKVRVEEINE